MKTLLRIVLLVAILLSVSAIAEGTTWKARTTTDTHADFIGTVTSALTAIVGIDTTSYADSAGTVGPLTNHVSIEPLGATAKWATATVNPNKGRLSLLGSWDSDSCAFAMQISADPDSGCEPGYLLNLIWKDGDWHGGMNPSLIRARSQIDTNSTIFEGIVEGLYLEHVHRGVSMKAGADWNTNELFFADADGQDSTYTFRAYGGQTLLDDQSRVRFVASPIFTDISSPITAGGKVTTNDTLEIAGPLVVTSALYHGVTARVAPATADSVFVTTAGIVAGDSLGSDPTVVIVVSTYADPVRAVGLNTMRVPVTKRLRLGSTKGFVLSTPALAVGDTVRYYWEIHRLK
jgi:hypothetical protein